MRRSWAWWLARGQATEQGAGMAEAVDRTRRWQRYWDRTSGSYDKQMAFMDRRSFGDSRPWACQQASGAVLEVAIGTGLNLPFYSDTVTLTGVDLSENMLDIARARAVGLRRAVTLRQGDAHTLPFPDSAFDTVVCTFGLCAIPDIDTAIDEMVRVLRPDGRLILVDHIDSPSRLARGIQRLLELITVPLAGEHLRRRPPRHMQAHGLDVEQRQRIKLGLVERLIARKTIA